MDLVQRYRDHIKNQNLFTSKEKLLLAVSGGVDSVVLCELCKEAGFAFVIAHCNFQLRGEESERDEKFVRKLAGKYKVDVLVKKFDTQAYANEKKISVQEAARNLRYQWFSELIEKENIADKLITAHHADDNIESLLMNFFRGTGLKGLTGIPKNPGKIRRPLLIFSKEELVSYAKENKLDWVEDSSNQSSDYTRNYLRNELLPGLRNVYPQVNENLRSNIHRFEEIAKLYTAAIGQLKQKLVRQKGNEWFIPVKQLMGYNNRALIYDIISDFGFSEKQVDEITRLASSQSGKYIDAPNKVYRIIRHRHWFIVSPVKTTESENIIVEENMHSILYPGGELLIDRLIIANPSTSSGQHSQQPIANSQQPTTENLNLDKIQFPLLLRKWKAGDYFYPLGMKKKKKLARFFIDSKLSKSEKENTWVLEMNQKIVCVLGHRIDERFKITEKKYSVLRLTIKRNKML